MKRRLAPRPGEWIDRSQTIEFRFEGAPYQGFGGDVLSSALWANDVRLLGRSFKYHRPRGIYSLANHDVNVMLEDEGRTNLRGDVLPLRAGLAVQAVNTFGGLASDRLRFTERLSALMPVGFYYKAFYTPRFLFPYFERLIRKVAGLGTVKPAPTAEHTPKDYAFCDLLVVGAGPAGLSAAIAAAECGLKVMLVEEHARPGGSLAWQWAGQPQHQSLLDDLIARMSAFANVEVRCSTEAGGWYPDHWIALFDQRRMTKLRARAIVVASGCFEQPAVFHNNDLPGVMLGSAALRLLHLFAVKPCDRAVVLTANSDGYRLALDLQAAGVEIAALADLRPEGETSDLADEVNAAAIPVLRNHTVYEAIPAAGKTRIQGAILCPPDDQIGAATERERQAHRSLAVAVLKVVAARRVECDGIVMSVGWAPAAGLLSQAGGRFGYDARVEQFVPATLPAGVFAAGRVNGVFELADQLADGRRAGLAAAAYLQRYTGPIPEVPKHAEPPPSHPYPIFAHPKQKNFVDLDEDLHLADFVNAHQEGYDNIELMKRYTTVGMGPSQGKLANMNAIRILARLNGRSIDETGTTTARPFHNPVPMAHLAGRRFHPHRRTPMHDWHVEAGAMMTHVGAWLRPEYYRVGSQDRGDCVLEEALCVRQRLGLIDVGTLGKIQVRGPNAAAFLERMYSGRFVDLKVGRLRYALGCDETGVVVEDGIVGRLGAEHFYVTTTTSGSAAWFRDMQRWAILWHMNVSLANVTGQMAAMNLAGPQARAALTPLTELDLAAAAFPFLGVREGMVCGVSAVVMRVGFVGELGYEIHVPAGYGTHIWTTLLKLGQPYGARPFGVEAQRLLRLEKGIPLIGHDTDALTSPFEAGLEWTIGRNKPFFVGQRSLEIVRKQPPTRRLVGFTLPRGYRGALPEECHLIVDGMEIAGRVTSFAPRTTLGQPLGLAFVSPAMAKPGTPMQIRLGDGRLVRAEAAATPFYDPDNSRQKIAEAGAESSKPRLPTPSRGFADSAPATQRRSPIYQFFEAGAAVRITAGDEEHAALRTLALMDLSHLTKLGVGGPGAEIWLRAQNVHIPATVYETARLPDDGIIVRTGADQFLLESGHANVTVPALADQLAGNGSGAYRSERQDATFLLAGARAHEVLAQTCAIDVRQAPPGQLILTRVAGINAGILPDTIAEIPAYRLWVDPSFAWDLWESLATIAEELGGRVVGVT